MPAAHEARWLALQTRAEGYLRHQVGHVDDDLLSEMVIATIEYGGEHINWQFIYLKALDRLDPRRTHRGAGRVRDSTRCESLTMDEGVVTDIAIRDEPDGQADIARRFPQGHLRAMLMLRLIHGWTLDELGYLFGMDESRLSQMLGQGRAEVLAWGAPEGEREIAVEALEVEWLVL